MEIGDEAEVEADVAALAGPAAGRQNALAQLESSLRPVERYAIRFLEEVIVALHAKTVGKDCT